MNFLKVFLVSLQIPKLLNLISMMKEVRMKYILIFVVFEDYNKISKL